MSRSSTVDGGGPSRPAPLRIARERVQYAWRALGAIAQEPYEGMDRVLDRLAEWREPRVEGWNYREDEEWERRLHELLGVGWPCQEREEFKELWPGLVGWLSARGLMIGRGEFGGWDDADPGLARATWCLARHLKPQVVLETGVARGLTSRVVLEALERNGTGHLWSIDLPPLLERDLASELGAAVPGELAARWTLLRGSSRRRLPSLARAVGPIDLFIHDSMHTERNVSFELGQVWPRLRPGGGLLVDDVNRNGAFARFSREHASAPALIAAADDRKALFGCVVRQS